jgi:hypothetical protein
VAMSDRLRKASRRSRLSTVSQAFVQAVFKR